MEKISNFSSADDPIHLPPGFRFHPTDEELITHYLSPKVIDSGFSSEAIGDVDLNKVEPWDLPWKAKLGEKEWYFFCLRDRKYPTGLRTNRATEAGYWKATGKDKEIFRAKILVGMKKTLVFYRGRAPRGEKTNWVMHEYRLEGKASMQNLPKTSKNEWVISRIFNKSFGGKKSHISGLIKTGNDGSDSQFMDLPPLMELSNDENQINPEEGSLVTCFSNPTEEPRIDEFTSSSSFKNCDFSQFSFICPKASILSSVLSSQTIPCTENSQFFNSVLMQDQSIIKLMLDNNGSNTKQKSRPESSGLDADIFPSEPNHEMGFKVYEDQEFPFISTGPVDLDCLWNY